MLVGEARCGDVRSEGTGARGALFVEVWLWEFLIFVRAGRGRHRTTIRAPAPGAAISPKSAIRVSYYLYCRAAIRAPALRRIINLPGRYLPKDNYIQVGS